MSISRISLFIALAILSGQLLASDRDMKINTMNCQVVESTTRTFEIGDGKVKNYTWMGYPKKDSQLTIDFKIVGNGCMALDFKPTFALIGLHHLIDFEKKEVHSLKNWIKSGDTVLKSSELTLYRNGIRLKSNNSRSSVDLRKRTPKEWDGHIVLDITGDNDYNSVQLISVTCKLTNSWDYLMEYIINRNSCGN
jgi:hypothetical protein